MEPERSLFVLSSDASGSDGDVLFNKGKGGGSGGGIFLHAFEVFVTETAALRANGGQGGGGQTGGGGGGGGRITLLSDSEGMVFVQFPSALQVASGAGGPGAADGDPGIVQVVETGTNVGVPAHEVTLIGGIALDIDGSAGEVDVQFSGFGVARGERLLSSGTPALRNGWRLESGDLTWFDDSPIPGEFAATLDRRSLEVFGSSNLDSVSQSVFELSASPALGLELANELGEEISSFRSLAAATLADAYYFEGVAFVPEPGAGLLGLTALTVLGGIRCLRTLGAARYWPGRVGLAARGVESVPAAHVAGALAGELVSVTRGPARVPRPRPACPRTS